MKKSIFVGVLLILSVVLMTTRTGFAADFLNFSESYEQTYACNWEDWELSCGAIDSGQFRVVGRVSLNGIDITQFNKSTPFTLSVSGFSFRGLSFKAALGDDPDYRRGNRSARVVFSNSEGRRDLRYLTVVLRWDSKNLTVAINGKTPQFLDTLMAAKYLGAETGPVNETVFGLLQFSDVSVNFQFTITGNVATEAVGLEGQASTLSKIELNGLGVIGERPMLKPEGTPAKGLTGR